MRNEVRSHVLGEHAALRRALAELEALAQRSFGGETETLVALRGGALALHEQLRRHMEHEDRWLGESVARDHAEQRLLLEYLLRCLGDETRPARVLAAQLADFVRCIREDMEREEKTLLAASEEPSCA
jgi:hemerythrin-like domain-containing protein